MKKECVKKRQRRREVAILPLCPITSEMYWFLCVSMRRAAQVEADQDLLACTAT